MEILTVNIADLNPAPYNPRKDLQPDDPEYKALEKSMAEFGYIDPLIWNRKSKTLVAGHQRLKILRAQGVDAVEVSVVDLDLERERALNIALNKIDGAWDDGQLAILFEEMAFDMVELTGFDMREVTGIVEGQAAIAALDAKVTEVTFQTTDGAKPPKTEMVSISYAVTPTQKTSIQGAIKRARLKTGVRDAAAALAAISEAYE